MSSSEERQFLSDFGYSLVETLVTNTTYTVLYGVFILLFSLSTVTLLRRGLSGTSAWAMFMATVMGFIIETVNIALRVAAFVTLIRSVLVNHPDLPLDAKYESASGIVIKLDIVIEWITNFLPLITDTVVVWRAWVLFPEKRWVMIPPTFILFTAIVLTLTYSVLTSSLVGFISLHDPDSIPSKLLTSIFVLSIAANALTTSLVAYKLWTHRKFVIEHLPGRQRSTAEDILFMVVESGIIYFCFQIVNLSLYLSPLNDTGLLAWRVFSDIYFGISAMYPTAVIVLVQNKRSVVDTYGFSSASQSSGEHSAGHISFATSPHQNSLNPGSFLANSSDTAIPEKDAWNT